MKNKLLLVHFGRSGSTVLVNMLGKHTRINWAAEIYTTEEEDKKNFIDGIDEFVAFPSAIEKPGNMVFGFELKYLNYLNHIRNVSPKTKEGFCELVDRFSKEGYTPFLLVRENVLRRMVSVRMGMERGIWHAQSNVHPASHTTVQRIELTVEYFRDWDTGCAGALSETIECAVGVQNYLIQFFKQRGWNVISYEKHIQDDPRIAYRKVLDWARIDYEERDADLQRTTGSRGLDTVLANYQEVAKHLKGTQGEWMLQD